MHELQGSLSTAQAAAPAARQERNRLAGQHAAAPEEQRGRVTELEAAAATQLEAQQAARERIAQLEAQHAMAAAGEAMSGCMLASRSWRGGLAAATAALQQRDVPQVPCVTATQSWRPSWGLRGRPASLPPRLGPPRSPGRQLTTPNS